MPLSIAVAMPLQKRAVTEVNVTKAAALQNRLKEKKPGP
jgi:hypothetical protein